MNRRGFTLLEVMVATLIMGIAVAGLLSALSTSLKSAGRLTDYDRAALLARQKMDELLLAQQLPMLTLLEGAWDPGVTAGLPMGWRARITPFEMPPGFGPGTAILERVELEIWWKNGDRPRSFKVEGFRRAVLTPADMAAGVGR
jgi:general secretion pathway protein I